MNNRTHLLAVSLLNDLCKEDLCDQMRMLLACTNSHDLEIAICEFILINCKRDLVELSDDPDIEWRYVIECLEVRLLPRTNKTPTPQPQPPKGVTPGVNSMSNTAFATKHYIYGVDVATMTPDQKIEAIRKVEASIKSYSEIDADSSTIAGRIADLQAQKAAIIESLDGVAPAKKSNAKA